MTLHGLPAKLLRQAIKSKATLPHWGAYLTNDSMLPKAEDCSDEKAKTMRGEDRPCDAEKGVTKSEKTCAHNFMNDDVSTMGSCQTSATTSSVAGRVWDLSRNAEGRILVQDFMDAAANDEERKTISKEFSGHVLEACLCPNANFVLQQWIQMALPVECQFIVDEVMSKGKRHVSHMCTNSSGCRVIQRMVEHLLPQQLVELVQAALDDALLLACSPFGNYVLRKILEFGSDSQRHILMMLLQANPEVATSNKYACCLSELALEIGAEEDRTSLARALVRAPGIPKLRSTSRHARAVARLVMELVPHLPV